MRETDCCVCGIKIYVDDNYFATLKEKHNIFHCLNGHGQHFTSKSDAEIQKEINKTLQQTCNERVEEMQKKVDKLKSLKHECTHCKNSYSSKGNLNRHIKKKHRIRKRKRR